MPWHEKPHPWERVPNYVFQVHNIENLPKFMKYWEDE